MVFTRNENYFPQRRLFVDEVTSLLSSIETRGRCGVSQVSPCPGPTPTAALLPDKRP